MTDDGLVEEDTGPDPDGLYRCPFVDPETGVACTDDERTPEAFDSHKARNTHAKSHRRRPCRVCGRLIKENGHTQHVEACSKQSSSLPWEVWDDLIGDLVRHAPEIPEGAYCVVTTSRGATFMTHSAAMRAVMLSQEATLVVPSDLLPKPADNDRWRRKDLNVTTAETETDFSEHHRSQPAGARPSTGATPDDQALPGPWASVL